MLRDLVTEQEPKGVSVPIPESVAEVTKASVRHPQTVDDRTIPSKRLRAMHRRSGSKLSLKEWVQTLRDADSRNIVNEWYQNKQGG